MDAAGDPATSIAAYRAGIRARNRWLANGEAPWVKGGLAVAKRHPLRAPHCVLRAAGKKMSKGAFLGDWGSPLEVWMRRFDR
jgi:hypothetical protein